MTVAPESAVAAARSVTIKNLEHAYDEDLVLHDINLSIAAGSSVALLGASGCGKTTLLRLIAGLERPRRGSIDIGDIEVAGPHRWEPPERRRIGMVFQDWALFPHLSVGRNVGYGLPRSARTGDRVSEALELVGLASLTNRMPATLSGGQQQRVALARALAPRPSILLLDEPFSNLDTALRVEVRSEVHRLLHDLGITSIFVTHDQEEAFVLGDEIAVMRDGRIIQVATPFELYTTPVDRQVAEFVGSGSIVASTAVDGFADSPCGRVPVTVDNGKVDVLFRPEQMTLVEGDVATVDLVEYYGHDTMVFVRPDGVDAPLLRVRSGPETHARRGQRVGLAFTGGTAVAFAS